MGGEEIESGIESEEEPKVLKKVSFGKPMESSYSYLSASKDYGKSFSKHLIFKSLKAISEHKKKALTKTSIFNSKSTEDKANYETTVSLNSPTEQFNI